MSLLHNIMVACFNGERSEGSFSEPLLGFPQPAVVFKGSVGVQRALFESRICMRGDVLLLHMQRANR